MWLMCQMPQTEDTISRKSFAMHEPAGTRSRWERTSEEWRTDCELCPASAATSVCRFPSPTLSSAQASRFKGHGELP